MDQRSKSSSVLISLALLCLCHSGAYGKGIVFEIEVVKDTVLVYEEVGLRLVLRNESTEAFIRRPFTVGPDYMVAELRNLDTGEDIVVSNVVLNRVRSSEEEVILYAGEEKVGTDDVLLHVTPRDESSDSPPAYLPPATYEVICVWVYDPDPDGLDPAVIPMKWADTARFAVLPATGRDHEALMKFLDVYTLCRESGPQECLETRWQLVSEYPETPYASDALGRVLTSVLTYYHAAPPDLAGC